MEMYVLPVEERAALRDYLHALGDDIASGKLPLLFYKVTPDEIGVNVALNIQLLVVPGGKR